MLKYGRVALLAIAGVLAMPAAQAQGSFFVGVHAGQATLSDSGFPDDSSDTQSLAVGYRWQAGESPVQIGIEGGIGRLGELSHSVSWPQGSEHFDMDADYAFIGANARFPFGRDSRWFAVARAGYMGYDQTLDYRHQETFNGQSYSSAQRYEDDGGGAYFGAGIGVDVTPNFNISAMLNGYAYARIYDDGDRYRFEDDVDTARTVTLGLELRF